MTTANKPGAALTAALDRMSFEFLSTNYPELVAAIERELNTGIQPATVRYIVLRHVGPGREGIALRCEQAARHMLTMRMEA